MHSWPNWAGQSELHTSLSQCFLKKSMWKSLGKNKSTRLEEWKQFPWECLKLSPSLCPWVIMNVLCTLKNSISCRVCSEKVFQISERLQVAKEIFHCCNTSFPAVASTAGENTTLCGCLAYIIQQHLYSFGIQVTLLVASACHRIKNGSALNDMALTGLVVVGWGNHDIQGIHLWRREITFVKFR